MKVIGIDPGLTVTGWGIVSRENNQISYISSGFIESSAKESTAQRLKKIHANLSRVVSEFKPDEFAIEKTFVNKNPLSSLKLGQARGVAILTASLHDLEVFEYAPNLIKKSVTGAGKADKRQVMTMIKFLLPSVQLKSKDEADALAVAICHCNSGQWTVDSGQ